MLLTLMSNLGMFGVTTVPSAVSVKSGSFGQWRSKKRKRYILPDGTIVMASPQEAAQVLRLLQAEYDIELEEPVEVRPTLRKTFAKPDEKSAEAVFPKWVPTIPDWVDVHVPTYEMDFEAAYRYYIEALLRRQEEDEWLMTIH